MNRNLLTTAITAALLRGGRLFLTEVGKGCWQIATDNNDAVFRRDELLRLRALIDEKIVATEIEKFPEEVEP